ncbi:HNH endonuclease [Hyalangium gracile]|uniref:HNH endonuclease n=1 Tax=Hyalangium gracile TaxID=394092 RepID=UPI001CCB5BF9|nr:HNH endonuclease [Hyalangium gracile]
MSCFWVISRAALTLFLFDTAFDDEVHELLVLLARDKQLDQTLGQMEAVREALARRGFQLSNYPDRDEQPSDVGRGLIRAVDDVAATIPVVDGARGSGVYGTRAHLPPPYQEAFDETERTLTEARLAPGNQVVGFFDHLTFGVPLGFCHLAAGTGHGLYTLTQGQYEQATRELAPAALLVSLYAGGKGMRYLPDAKGAVGGGEGGMRLQVPELRLQGLKEVAERLRVRLGEDGVRQLALLIQGRREVAVMVAAGGERASVALHEARGDLARAQAVFSQAKPEPGGGNPAKPGAAQPLRGAAATQGAPLLDIPIRNAHLAGQRHPVTGVPFDAEGYPDFRAAGAVKAEVKITYTGSRARDFAAANAAAGLRETPKGMTWHHHQDRTTMQLVPTETHAKTGHTGGFSGDL